MKALNVLKWLANNEALSGAFHNEANESIAELEALKYNYEAQEIIIRDKTALIGAMANNIEALQATIQEQQQKLNEYAYMIYKASKPKSCGECKWLDDCAVFELFESQYGMGKESSYCHEFQPKDNL